MKSANVRITFGALIFRTSKLIDIQSEPIVLNDKSKFELMLQSIHFPSGKVDYYFNSAFEILDNITNEKIILLTDDHISELYQHPISKYPTIIIPHGENSKSLATLEQIIKQLIALEADRKTVLVGIGGGVVTDICGFVASIYMRGINFGFIPTSILAMTDAAIGGKNGIDVDVYKNMLGCFNQPEFIIYDSSFLNTLPDAEWSNGFAEIVKYACLFDIELFHFLNSRDVNHFHQNEKELFWVIERCVQWKNKIVMEDEKEKGNRKLLNFGHTVGHAIEKQYQKAHGAAISIGMIVACIISEHTTELDKNIRKALTNLLKKYQLPITLLFDITSIMTILKMDKKRNNGEIDFIVLTQLGHSTIKTISLDIIQEALIQFGDECNN